MRFMRIYKAFRFIYAMVVLKIKRIRRDTRVIRNVFKLTAVEVAYELQTLDDFSKQKPKHPQQEKLIIIISSITLIPLTTLITSITLITLITVIAFKL
jgi:hypothetical protein